jgi:homeobox protein YOX1/YHP1
MRSPNPVYSSTPNPQYQSLTSTAYPAGLGPSRGTVAPVAATTPHYHHHHHHPPAPVTHVPSDRQVQGSRVSALPYARPAMSPVGYEPPAEVTEPSIKKKRRRADARQLEALNSTYNRTAFPSTEERTQLAKDLDMSARSVQIWLVSAPYPRFLNRNPFSQVPEQKAGSPSRRTQCCGRLIHPS